MFACGLSKPSHTMSTRNPTHFPTLFLLIIVLCQSDKSQCEKNTAAAAAMNNGNHTTVDDYDDQPIEEPIALPLIADNLYTNVSSTGISVCPFISSLCRCYRAGHSIRCTHKFTFFYVLLSLFLGPSLRIVSTTLLLCKQSTAAASTHMPDVHRQYMRNIFKKSIGFCAAPFDARLAGR